MGDVVHLFEPTGDESDEYVPSFPVADEATTMRERANRIYTRHLVERGFARAGSDEVLSESVRGKAKPTAYRDEWSADDQAAVDAWLENDPWASRLAMRLDELAGKDSGTTTREGEAIRSQGLITHERVAASSDASTVRNTTPIRGPKKVGSVPTREGNGAPSSRPSRVGSLTELRTLEHAAAVLGEMVRDEGPPRLFVAPLKGPAEVVITVKGPAIATEAVVGTSRTNANNEESNMGADPAVVSARAERQRKVLELYKVEPRPALIAKKLGVSASSINNDVYELRKSGLITTAPAAGVNAGKAAASKARKPKVIAAPRAAAREVKAPSRAARSGDDPLLEAMRQRRAALIADHQAKLARIDAAIAAFTE